MTAPRHLSDLPQGDGEAGGTAIECGMTSELVLDLVADPPLTSIHAVTPMSRITFGFNADLNLATAEALKARPGVSTRC